MARGKKPSPDKLWWVRHPAHTVAVVSAPSSYEQQQIVRQYCIERGKKGTAPEKKVTGTKKKRS